MTIPTPTPDSTSIAVNCGDVLDVAQPPHNEIGSTALTGGFLERLHGMGPETPNVIIDTTTPLPSVVPTSERTFDPRRLVGIANHANQP